MISPSQRQAVGFSHPLLSPVAEGLPQASMTEMTRYPFPYLSPTHGAEALLKMLWGENKEAPVIST